MTEEERREIIEEWEEEIRKEDEDDREVSYLDRIYQENGFASEKDFWRWKEGI